MMGMKLREIDEGEVYRLRECVRQLSEHHNRVSEHFKGAYPSRPYEVTLQTFSEALKNGLSHIAVIEDAGRILGFCKADIGQGCGKLDYLAVLEEYRGRGHGSRLMDWAMETFRQNGCSRVEVKVVAGNEAIRLYEKYGFRINSYILWRQE